MGIFQKKTNRRIVPRWRSSKRAVLSPEFSSLSPPKRILSQDINAHVVTLEDFKKYPSIGTAAEVLTSSLVESKPELASAAIKFLLDNEHSVPKTLLKLAKSVEEGTNPFNTKSFSKVQQISHVRKLLKITPQNPTLWCDLARHYASQGDNKYANRCIAVALQLAPNHRWILRTTSRFYIHQENFTAAHSLLANHPLTRTDPWLIAAELACAQVAEKKPKFWKQANEILSRNTHQPHHTTELAIAIAMMELEAGQRKKARKYVDKGLISPTENSLAQVFWAQVNRHLPDADALEDLVRKSHDAYEADYQLSLNEGRLQDAVKSAETWSDDEPFASRPIAAVAYAASLLDDYDLTIKATDQVLRLDKEVHVTVEMNRIFACLSSNKYSYTQNSQEINRIESKLIEILKLRNDDSYHAIANLGLLNYRYGDKALGKEFYDNAILIAERHHHHEAAAMAAIFAAREAILAGDATALKSLERAENLNKKIDNKAGEFYIRKIKAILKTPDNVKFILSPASASTFSPKIEEKPLFRLERASTGNILWINKK